MNILVCIKQVPDTTEIRMDPKTNTLIRAGVPSTVNPFDKYALEAAVQLREALPAVVTVVKAINEPRLPNVMRKLQANRMQPQTLTADDLPALDPDCIGLHGSPTKVSRTFVPVRTKQTVRIDGAQPEAAVASLLAQLDAAHISLEGGGDHV